jgi:DNA-directed RNA polymerase subunit RPC12/RpoP
MAIVSPCIRCGTEVSHRANQSPFCDDCSGRSEGLRLEKERWAALTDAQKIEELLERVRKLEASDGRRGHWDERLG